MPVYHEVLPAGKDGKARGFRWTPTGRGRGLLVIQDARSSASYDVAEFPADGEGRGFRFACLGGQSDREAPESYDVYVSRNRQDVSCECRGFLRWRKPCKHVLAALDLITNGWLESSASNPEADTGPTEIREQVEPPF